jgi:MFS family permease
MLVRIPEYRRLFAARVVSNLGNGIAPIALAFGVLSLPGGNAGSLSIVTTAHMIPLVLFMLIGGVAADRFGRARLVGLTDIIGSAFVAVSALSFLTHHSSIALLSFNAFVFGVLNALWYPAFTGLMPQVVPPHLLQAANSMLGFGANLAMTVGASVAGVIVASTGSGWALLIDAISFLIAGLIVFTLRHLDRDAPVEAHERTSTITQLREGWHEFSSRRWIVVMVSSAAFFHMPFEGFLGVIAPVQTKEALNGARDMGFMMSGFGFGAIVGTVLALRWRPKHPLRAVATVMPLCSLWVLGLSVPTPLWTLVGCAFLAGVAIDVMYANWMTTLQTNVPDEAMSRVGAYDAFGSLVFAPIGLFIAGPLTKLVGASTALRVAGLMALAAAVTPLLFRDVRQLRRVQA